MLYFNILKIVGTINIPIRIVINGNPNSKSLIPNVYLNPCAISLSPGRLRIKPIPHKNALIKMFPLLYTVRQNKIMIR